MTLSYYLKFRKDAVSRNPKVKKTKSKKIRIFSEYAVSNRKKSRFIKE